MPTKVDDKKPDATKPTAADYRELLAPLNDPDEAKRPPTDAQGRLEPTKKERKAEYIPGVEGLAQNRLKSLRKAMYDVVATLGAHIFDTPELWWEVHDAMLLGALDPTTGRRNGRGPCRDFKDWKKGKPDRRGNKTRNLCIESMKKDDEKHLAKKKLLGLITEEGIAEDAEKIKEGIANITSDDELSLDGTPSTIQMGSRMLRKQMAAENARAATGASASQKVSDLTMQLEAIEGSMGLTSPGKGCSLPPGMPFPLKDPHSRGVRVLSQNTSSKMGEYAVCMYLFFIAATLCPPLIIV